MNELGAILLVLSGATVVFSIITAILGMSLRTERNLARSLTLEIIDNRMGGRRGPSSLAGAFARKILEVWRPAKSLILRFTGLRTQAMALSLSRQAFYVNFLIVTVAFLTLMYLMVSTNLQNKYVVTNSSPDLPIFFRMTGTWAGSSGSLLFWYFLLTLFTATVVYQVKERLFNRQPALFLILGVLNMLFILLCLFFKDAQPFLAYDSPMGAGRGLNPLLLHWAMVIHPPILYIGYVGFAIPFAIALSAVISGNMHEDWLKLIRRWAIFAWFFLGVGILLGSKWAYEELGWGGYWAWDPVENASLMPFLLATAFLHTLIVHERRGMLRFWNIVLITLTYHMCLLGTWITRSGILQGPHTFSQSSIGTPFIIYIFLSLFFFMRYLYFMRHKLRPRNTLKAVTSKEGSMLFNNFMMSLATIIILVGVFSPLLPLDCVFSPEFSCRKVEWKQSTYNKVMVPLGILTLFLMGASPLLTWRKNAGQVYARNLRLPFIVGIIACVAFALGYGALFTRAPGADVSAWGGGFIAEVFAILTVGVAAFVVTGLGLEYVRGVRSRRERFGENPLIALVRLILRNKRRYAGYLNHLAVVFLFLGYAGGAFKKTQKFDFHYFKAPQQTGSPAINYVSVDKAYLEDYEIQARYLFLSPEFKPGAAKNNPIYFTVSQESHYNIQKGFFQRKPYVTPETQSMYVHANRPPSRLDKLSKFLFGIFEDGRMKTERQFHPQINQYSGEVLRDGNSVARRIPTSKPDIRSTWSEDIYVQLGSISDPVTGKTPALSHLYEFFYYQTEQSPEAYRRLFPNTLVATLEVWINPMVKFIWLGSILFFLSGLVILLPFGERDLTK